MPWDYGRLTAAKKSSSINARNALQAQAAGERWKFALTLLLFAAVFKNYAQIVPLSMFLAYSVAVVIYWLALLKTR